MASGQPSKRLTRAKSEVAHRRTSMDSLKTDFRNRFLERLKTTRSKSVDRLRHIVETYDHGIECRSLNELRQALLADHEATALINTEEVSELLQEVEDEMQHVSLEYQAESYVNQSQKETDDIVNRLLSVCKMCENLSFDTICPNCNVQLRSEFK